MSMKDSIKTPKKQYKKDAKGQYFVKGTAPGPGRPPGSLSIIGRLKQMWQEDPDDFELFVKQVRSDKYLRRELIHQIDGKPKERIELSGGLKFERMEELTDDELNQLASEGEG